MKSRLKTFIDNTPERTLIIFAMLISVVFWSSISGYLKIQRYYRDEWLYLQTAYAIKNGYGLDAIYGIKGLGAGFGRYVYSFLIAPACLIKDIGLRFKAIALTNAISMSSSAIPVYLLAREMSVDKRKRLLAVIIALTMPYMNYCACFMSENILIPISLWIIYFNYMLIRFADYPKGKNIKRIAITTILLVLAWYTKQSGRIFLLMELVTIILAFTYHNIEKIKNNLFRYVAALVGLGFAMFGILFYVASYDGSIGLLLVLREVILKYISYINPLLWDSVVYIFISLILALGIIPIIYYLISIKNFNFGDKLFSLWILILTLLLILEVVSLSYERYYMTLNGFNEGFTQIHFRYIVYVFLPIMVFFLKATEFNKSPKISSAIVLCVFMFAFWNLIIFFYKGAQLEHAASYTLLHWVRNIGEIHRTKIIFSIFIAGIIGLFIYVYINCPKKILPLFLVVWIPIQIFNNVETHKAFIIENELDDTSMLDLREFILEHEEDEFILVDMAYVRTEAPCLWRGDAYLDAKNIIRYSPDLLFTAEFPCDLNSFYAGCAPAVDVSNVKYILICSTLKPIDTNEITDLKVGDGTWYNLYELKTIGNLPTIEIAGDGE